MPTSFDLADRASQLPFGFKFTRNFVGRGKDVGAGTRRSQLPFGFKFTRNPWSRETKVYMETCLNCLSALSSLGTSLVEAKMWVLEHAGLNCLSALSSLGTRLAQCFFVCSEAVVSIAFRL